jgi:tetratricopeptide (TPR) repeat protein
MRILVVMSGAHTPGAWTNRWLVPGLIAEGHLPVCLDPMLLAGLLGASGAQAVLVAAAKVYRPHLILTQPPYDLIFPETAAAWTSLGIPSLGWRTDDAWFLADLGNRPEQAARAFTLAQSRYTLVGTASRQTHDWLKREGFRNVAFLPLAMPLPPEPLGPLSQDFGISFVGSAFARTPDATEARQTLLRHVAMANLPLTVFGRGWEQIPGIPGVGFAPEETLTPIFRQSTATLALDQWQRATFGFRPLQTTLAGGLAVVRSSPDLADYFERDREIVTADSQAELHDRLRWLVEHPQHAAAIAAAGHQRARRDHTFGRGWSRVMAALQQHLGRPLEGGNEAGDEEAPDRDALPIVVTALLGLAHMLEAKQRFAEADYLFRMIIGVQPDDFGARAALARLRERLGELDDAQRLWAHAATLVPTLGYGMDMRLNALPSSALNTPETAEPHIGALIEVQRLAIRRKDAPSFLATLPELLPYSFDEVLTFAESLLEGRPQADERDLAAAIVERLLQAADRHPMAKDRLMNLRRLLSYGTK